MEKTSLKPGTRIGHYVIERFVAIGGAAVVYYARDPRAGRHLAIKLLLDGNRADREHTRRFFREARSYTRLIHPRIVTLYEVGEYEDVPFLAMEWVEGQTLAEHLEKGPLEPGTILEIAKQLADGLSAAHAVGLVHRDIKPSNIMLTPSGEVKLLDFGLAKELSERSDLPHSRITRENVIVGTPAYMAPEQVRGEDTTTASDVFSFGALLYEMLSGRPAFARTSQLETLNAVSRAQRDSLPRPASRIEASLQQLCQRCLETQADRRPRDARELVVELSRLSETTAPAGKLNPQRAALLASGTILLLLLGLFLGRMTGSSFKAPTSIRGARILPVTGNLPLLEAHGSGIVHTSLDQRELWLSPFGGQNPQLIWAGKKRILSFCLAPDGRAVVFASAEDSGRQWIWEVPINGGLPRKITEGRDPAISPDGNFIASLSEADARTHRLILTDRDGSTRRILSSFQGPYYPLSCIFPGRNSSIVVSMTDSIRYSRLVEIEVADGKTREISILPGVARRGLAFSGSLQTLLWPIQSTLWATCKGMSRPVYPAAGLLQNPSITENGERLLLNVGRHESELVEVDVPENTDRPGSSIRILPGTHGASQPRVSPDGRLLVYESARDDLWLMDLRTGSTGPLLTTGEAAYNPAWSPDGKSVVYSCLKEHRSALWTAGADGSNPRRLTGSDANSFQPVWHPDGRHIFFISDREGPEDLFVLDLQNGKTRRIGYTGAVNPALSPDGIHIAWVQPGESSGAGLCLGKITKGMERIEMLWREPVTINRWAGGKPRFSPDGERIAFDQPSGPVGADIWVLPVNRRPGDVPRRLTAFESPVSLVSWFDWARDGKLVITLARKPESFLLIEDADLWIRQAMH